MSYSVWNYLSLLQNLELLIIATWALNVVYQGLTCNRQQPMLTSLWASVIAWWKFLFSIVDYTTFNSVLTNRISPHRGLCSPWTDPICLSHLHSRSKGLPGFTSAVYTMHKIDGWMYDLIGEDGEFRSVPCKMNGRNVIITCMSEGWRAFLWPKITSFYKYGPDTV